MQHWCRPATNGAEFCISCKLPAFLSCFSCLQGIQNKRPWCWAAAYVTAGCNSVLISAMNNSYLNFVNLFAARPWDMLPQSKRTHMTWIPIKWDLLCCSDDREVAWAKIGHYILCMDFLVTVVSKDLIDFGSELLLNIFEIHCTVNLLTSSFFLWFSISTF